MSTQQWLHENSSELYCYLTTTGRVSGKPHRIEIWFAVDGDRMLMMAGAREKSDWVKNILANPTVKVELGSETHTGTAMIIGISSPDNALAREMLVAKYQKDAELADWRVESLPVVITFDTEG